MANKAPQALSFSTNCGRNHFL